MEELQEYDWSQRGVWLESMMRYISMVKETGLLFGIEDRLLIVTLDLISRSGPGMYQSIEATAVVDISRSESPQKQGSFKHQ